MLLCMKMLLILSGWTRGLGEGILRAYSDIHGKNLAVIAIARSENRNLADAIGRRIGSLQVITGSLAEAAEADRIITELETCQGEVLKAFGSPEKSILINNAAVIGPIMPLPQVADRGRFYEEAQAAFALNCTAPALLSGWFLDRGAGGTKLIINISSGASQGAMNGAGIYSMTKTALNMLGRILVQEQELRGTAVKILSLSPGMVETYMQESLRASKTLPNAELFRRLS